MELACHCLALSISHTIQSRWDRVLYSVLCVYMFRSKTRKYVFLDRFIMEWFMLCLASYFSFHKHLNHANQFYRKLNFNKQKGVFVNQI